MKNFFIYVAVVAFVAACGASASDKAILALEQNTRVYDNAIEEIKNAESEDDIAAIVENTAHSIDSLRETEEWEAYVSVVTGDDSLEIEKIVPMQDAMREAALEFSDILAEKVISFIE